MDDGAEEKNFELDQTGSAPPASDASKQPDGGELKAAIDTYWREFQYRHSHCMNIFYRSTIIICIIAITPYIQDGKIGALQKYSYIFPLFSLPLSLMAGWLIYAEFLRMGVSLTSYHAATRRLKYSDGSPTRLDPENFPAMYKFSVAKMLAIFVMLLGIVVSSASLAVLLHSR